MTLRASNLPATRPSLTLDFAKSRRLDPRITFARASIGTFVDSRGILQTAPVNVARFDHNPTTGESLGLLVEELRTNSVTNNTMVGAVAGTPGTLPTSWGNFTSPAGLTRTIVASGTVNGINYIDVRFNGTPSSTGEITLYLSPATTATLAQAWTSTAWLSLAGGSTSNIATISFRNFELNSGVYVRETGVNFVSSISSDFVRRQNVTTSFGSGANQIQLVFSMYATAAGTPIDITLRIGLPQLEQGAFATSVIPTTTAQATRSADVASITGTAFSSWYRQGEGTWFADFNGTSIASGQFSRIIELNDGTSSNLIRVQQYAANLVRVSVSTNGAGQFAADNGSVAVGIRGKVAFGSAFNDAALVTNGASPTVDTAYLTPVGLTQLGIGAPPGGSTSVLNSTIRRITYWPQALPSQLQALTQ